MNEKEAMPRVLRAYAGNPLFPTVETKDEFLTLNKRIYEDELAHLVSLNRDGVTAVFEHCTKTFKYPKKATVEWLVDRLTALRAKDEESYRWKKVPRSVGAFCKLAKNLCNSGATIEHVDGKFVLRYRAFTAEWEHDGDGSIAYETCEKLCKDTQELRRLQDLLSKCDIE